MPACFELCSSAFHISISQRPYRQGCLLPPPLTLPRQHLLNPCLSSAETRTQHKLRIGESDCRLHTWGFSQTWAQLYPQTLWTLVDHHTGDIDSHGELKSKKVVTWGQVICKEHTETLGLLGCSISCPKVLTLGVSLYLIKLYIYYVILYIFHN